MSNSFYFVTILISSLVELAMLVSDCAELPCVFLHSQLASTSKIRHGLRLADGVGCLVLWAHPSTKMFFSIRELIISALCILIRCIHSYSHLIFFLFFDEFYYLFLCIHLWVFSYLGLHVIITSPIHVVSPPHVRSSPSQPPPKL